MKIIQVIGSLGDGGAERVVLNLDLLFKKNGIDSKIIVLHEKLFYDTTGNTIINLNTKKSKAKKPLLKLLSQENPDLVLLHMQDMSRLLKSIQSNTIYHVIHTDIYERLKHLNLFKKFKKIRDYKKIYRSKNIITVSKNIQNGFDKLHITPSSIQTIYNPFNIDQIRELSTGFTPKEKNYIIHVGSLRQVKRQDILLRAFAKLKTSKKLLLLGDGPKKSDLMNLAKELKIDKRIHFLGWQKNPYPYIKNADLLVLSSEAEGLSNVLIESLILYTPVVSTNCNSGPREILIDELKPYLAKINDVNSLANIIESTINDYPKISLKHYEKFNDNNIINSYLDIIKSIKND